ncbi:MAG: sigma-70 family RNA polymerase sigma factor [Candidatus Eisenbacteria bacterium]
MRERRLEKAGDRDLADAVFGHGDETAFRALYRRHTPRLYRFVLRFAGGHEADAEDVVQETWMRACRGLERFRWDSAFSTWLLAIGRRAAVDLLRKRSAEAGAPEGEAAGPIQRAAPLQERIDLEGAIARLPDGYRQVFLLHDVEGMKHREIAELLGISDGTSKSQLSRARGLLRVYLAGAEDGGGRVR